ncbi:hypothetical protein BJY01DRAFT_241892 [Aspergillus pseudoustus]|uniref:RING-type domain-containing protein n=1 Tax=Aspergillus pseudoustus TaxID=1810923 RepID=A0ABR4L1Z6_9EURO
MPTNPPTCPLCIRRITTACLQEGHIVVCHRCGRAYAAYQHEYCPHCTGDDETAAVGDLWSHDNAMIWLAQFARRQPEVEELTYKLANLSLEHLSEEEYHRRVANLLLEWLAAQGQKQVSR